MLITRIYVLNDFGNKRFKIPNKVKNNYHILFLNLAFNI